MTLLETYIFMKTQPESDHMFNSYEQLKYSQNNKKQDIHSFIQY